MKSHPLEINMLPTYYPVMCSTLTLTHLLTNTLTTPFKKNYNTVTIGGEGTLQHNLIYRSTTSRRFVYS